MAKSRSRDQFEDFTVIEMRLAAIRSVRRALERLEGFFPEAAPFQRRILERAIVSLEQQELGSACLWAEFSTSMQTAPSPLPEIASGVPLNMQTLRRRFESIVQLLLGNSISD